MDQALIPQIHNIFEELKLPFSPNDVEREDGAFYRFSLLIIIELLRKWVWVKAISEIVSFQKTEWFDGRENFFDAIIGLWSTNFTFLYTKENGYILDLEQSERVRHNFKLKEIFHGLLPSWLSLRGMVEKVIGKPFLSITWSYKEGEPLSTKDYEDSKKAGSIFFDLLMAMKE